MEEVFLEMFNFFKRLVFFVVLLCLVACKSSVTYYDESRKPPPAPNYNPYSNPGSYNRNYRPNSRRYQNPYELVPRNYSPYYDQDNYYVPPRGYEYYNQDNQFDGGSSNRMNMKI